MRHCQATGNLSCLLLGPRCTYRLLFVCDRHHVISCSVYKHTVQLLLITQTGAAPCRLAQAALDKEDVSETFLKGLPSKTDRYDVIYPVRRGMQHAQSSCNARLTPST